MGLHDSFQVESSKTWILIYNIRYKHLLKFQTRRGTPVSFSYPQEAEKSKSRKKEKILNFSSFRKNALLVSQTFKIMLAEEVTVNAWARFFFFFFLEVTWKKIALCVQFWKLFLRSSRLPQTIRLPWTNLGLFFFPTFCFMHPKNQSKNTITFFQ